MRKEIAEPFSAALIGLALLTFGIAASAAEREWIYPTIQRSGKIASQPQAGIHPSKDSDHKAVNPQVEIILSAVSDLIILEQQGYVFLPT